MTIALETAQDAMGILLVDDHRENLTALRAVLEPLGERLVSAESGEQALRVLLREEISVILLDVRMAGIDGVETARLIRSRSRTKHIPIIFLTAQASDVAEVALAYKTGGVDYVIKPFDPDILRAKVSVFIELHRERAERVRQSEARSRAEAMARAARTLQSLSDTALSHLELDGLGPELLKRTSELFEADAAALLMPTDDNLGLRVSARCGLPVGFSRTRVVTIGETLLGRIALSYSGALLTGDEVVEVLGSLREIDAQGPLALALSELLIVPMVSGGQLVGLLLLGSAAGRFRQADLELLLLAADRMALAIRHAQRFAEGRELVETLQRSLLPESLPHHPRLALAARYLPCGIGQRVGGDWYDALELDRDRTVVMIGDVVGHGISAATKMSQLRNALRAYAAEGHSPTRALELLDRLVQSTFGPEMVGTVLCVVIDVAEQTLTVARAGHPPPVVRGVDGTVRFLDSDSMLPIGVEGRQPVRESVHAIVPGETLLLFTDGLVERRRESISIGLERLAHALRGAPAEADALCDYVLSQTTSSEVSTSDDIALLAVTLLPSAIERLDLVLNATPDSVPEARHGLRRWLEATVPALDGIVRGDLELVMTEACTNVVRHAYESPLASYTASAALEDDAIALEVRDGGCWRPPGTADGGHGIPLMQELSDELEIDSGAEGTTVRLRVQLSGVGYAAARRA